MLVIVPLALAALATPVAAQDYGGVPEETTPTSAEVLDVVVTPAEPQAIPRTGDDSTVPMVQVGVGLLAVGGLAVCGARWRQQTRDSS